MSVALNHAVQARPDADVTKPFASASRPLSGLARIGVGRSRTWTSRGSVVKQSSLLGKKLYGTRLQRGSVSETLHQWKSDGPGRDPKLKVVVRSALSLVPEKPLGLYDPSFDKDACGVGFVAELSGKSNRNTVCIIFACVFKFVVLCLFFNQFDN